MGVGSQTHPTGGSTFDDLIHPSGSTLAGCVVNGPFANWVFDSLYDGYSKGGPRKMCLSRSRTLTKSINGRPQSPFSGHWELFQQISAGNYFDMEPNVEGMPHAIPHNNLRGHMRSFISPGDPLFFSHHSMIDKVFSMWQDCHDIDIFDYRDKTTTVDPAHYSPRCCKEDMNWGDSVNRECCENKADTIKRQGQEDKVVTTQKNGIAKKKVNFHSGERKSLGCLMKWIPQCPSGTQPKGLARLRKT